jgi:hypothetical protein
MPNPQWLEEMFQRYSLGELQAGLEFATPIRRKTPDKEWKSEIVLSSVKSKGTRIPASTLSKFRSHDWTPRQTSLKKLKALNDRFNYNRLRSSGANRNEARRLFRSKEVEKVIADYRKYTKAISEGKGVDLANVLWGMQQSDRSYSSWAGFLSEGGSKAADDVLDYPEEYFEDDEWEQWLGEGEDFGEEEGDF